MKFQLEIELGNEAMQSGFDLAMTLRTVADRLINTLGTEPIQHVHERVRGINDTLGNTVGSWKLGY